MGKHSNGVQQGKGAKNSTNSSAKNSTVNKGGKDKNNKPTTTHATQQLNQALTETNGSTSSTSEPKSTSLQQDKTSQPSTKSDSTDTGLDKPATKAAMSFLDALKVGLKEPAKQDAAQEKKEEKKVEKKTVKGVLDDAAYAQSSYNAGSFSDPGIEYYSGLAGRDIVTNDDLVQALKNKEIMPSQVPIDYIIRDGHTLILNTRSSHALSKAGIPRNQWNAVNRSGNKQFERRLTDQLNRNGLTSSGTHDVQATGLRKY